MIAPDKKKHMLAGAIVSLASFWISPQLTLLLVFVIGVLKEIYDHYGNGTVDIWDVAYTVLGGLPLILMMEFKA